MESVWHVLLGVCKMEWTSAGGFAWRVMQPAGFVLQPPLLEKQQQRLRAAASAAAASVSSACVVSTGRSPAAAQPPAHLSGRACVQIRVCVVEADMGRSSTPPSTSATSHTHYITKYRGW